jgi:hypothetical protein
MCTQDCYIPGLLGKEEVAATIMKEAEAATLAGLPDHQNGEAISNSLFASEN